jgi:predicted transcriptional regulator
MKILWARGKLSAREVHDAIADREEWEYSTTRTVLGRMVKKGLLSKRTFHGIQLYQARITRVQALAKLVREFAERVVQVDPALVVPLFARGEALTSEEIEEMSRILDETGEVSPE